MTTRRHMLPGALLEEPGSKRTGRDWLVDVAMLLIAIAIGIAVFSPTEDQHSDVGALVDVVFGVIGWIALWWRRRWPVAVAVITLTLSAVSAFDSHRKAGACMDPAEVGLLMDHERDGWHLPGDVGAFERLRARA